MFCCDAPFLLPLCFYFGSLRAACALGASLSAPPPLFFLCPLALSFRSSRPRVPWASALCGCPPPPSQSLSRFFCAPFVSAFSLFPALGALGLYALRLPAPLFSFFLFLFFFFSVLAVRQFPLLGALALGTAWLSFSFLRRALCGACVVRWCCLPPPRRLLLVFCGVPCLVVWC